MTSLKLSVIVLCCLVSFTLATSSDDEDKPKQNHQRGSSSYLSDIRYLYKTYSDCQTSDLSTCLKLKLFTILDRISRSVKDYKVVDGLSFERETNEPIDITPLQSENDIDASLPRSLDDKDQTLNQLIYDKVLSFFGSHTLKVTIQRMIDCSINSHSLCFQSIAGNNVTQKLFKVPTPVKLND